MLGNLLWKAGGALLALLAIITINKLLAHVNRTIKAHQYGCKPPPRFPHIDPLLGLDFFFAQIQEHKAGNMATAKRERFSRLGKTYEVNEWGKRSIYTMDQHNIREVLVTSFEKFGVEDLRLHISKPFIGPGVFNTDGRYWKYSRKLIRPVFSRLHVADFTHIDVHIDRLLQRLPRDGSTVELQSLLKFMYLDHSTEMIFGESIDTMLQETPSESANALLETYSAALRTIGFRSILDRLWTLPIFFTMNRKFADHASKIHAVIDRYIDAAIARRQQKHDPDDTSNTRSTRRYIITDELVKVIDDRIEIRDQLLNIFLAARDSAAIGLTNCLFHLARHPNVWEKLRAEVLSIQGPLTYSGLKSMSYLQAVMNESLRLNAPAAQGKRTCIQDCILPTGGGPDGNSPVYMSKGDEVTIIFGSMHRDKEIWGEDAHKFRPGRWENFEKDTGAYMPFSVGQRICPGKDLAMTENAYILVRLMRELEVLENRDPVLEYVEQRNLTVESRNGLKVGLIPAKHGY